MSWLRDYNISVDNLKEEDVMFGKSDIADDFQLFNNILPLGKFTLGNARMVHLLFEIL